MKHGYERLGLARARLLLLDLPLRLLAGESPGPAAQLGLCQTAGVRRVSLRRREGLRRLPDGERDVRQAERAGRRPLRANRDRGHRARGASDARRPGGEKGRRELAGRHRGDLPAEDDAVLLQLHALPVSPPEVRVPPQRAGSRQLHGGHRSAQLHRHPAELHPEREHPDHLDESGRAAPDAFQEPGRERGVLHQVRRGVDLRLVLP